MNERGFISTITRTFISSKLTPLLIAGAILLGIFAIINTPREEEPQIIVPMIDVFVQMPGATPKEIEQRITFPMEKLLWEISGVEYIYSVSMPGQCMITVRFYVGEDEEKSIVKFYNKLYSHLDLIPPGASFPLIKPRHIDDIPILLLTLWSDRYSSYTLRRVAKQLEEEITNIQDISITEVFGGEKRQFRIIVDSHRLKAYHVSLSHLITSIQQANQSLETGHFSRDNREFLVKVGNFIQSSEDLEKVVVGTWEDHPVYLRDVAQVIDGPEEPNTYLFFATGLQTKIKGITDKKFRLHQAVTLAVAKRKGKNATVITKKVLKKIEALKGKIIPSGVEITVTRDYGETAKEKSNELLKHLFIATISVTILIGLFLGYRASLIIFVAIPNTLCLTLFIYYFLGYTLNRVTLFALIFCIGILVDDPIVDVENIIRHFRMPENQTRPILEVIVGAVNEVRSPLILATFTVIAAIIPMAFVRGLMGPYMRPIPIGASIAMLFSMAIAFIITPWTAYHILGRRQRMEKEHSVKEDFFTRRYRIMMEQMLSLPSLRCKFLLGTTMLFLIMLSLFLFKAVKVKMLPFDNKSEFLVVIDMPEGTTLEQTARVTKEIGEYLSTVPEVTDYTHYIGMAAPYNFNGLVRHYFLRKGPHVACIQVNLLPKGKRTAQSHAIARRVRPFIKLIGSKYDARIKVAEIPPGPPVLQTLVAEVYGPDYERQIDLAGKILKIFEHTQGVVDSDWYVEEKQPRYTFIVDKEKASLAGITTQEITSAMKIALQGDVVGLAHLPREKEDVSIFLQLPRAERSHTSDLKEIPLASPSGKMISLSELVKLREETQERNIYHKNLKPVVYVTGDVAGSEESPVYAIAKLKKEINKIQLPEGYQIKQYSISPPFLTDKFALKWDGEWQITYEVFRDLGLAFIGVLILIYILVVSWFKSLTIPFAIMSPIPLSLIGIIPAHALMGAFFTATSMIGFIAGAGIVVRNSIILVDFIEVRLKEGMPLDQAVIDAGAVRFRPMLLTAMAVIVGASVILFDPIFQGLALSLMAGEVASTLFSRMIVPILYYLNKKRSAK